MAKQYNIPKYLQRRNYDTATQQSRQVTNIQEARDRTYGAREDIDTSTALAQGENLRRQSIASLAQNVNEMAQAFGDPTSYTKSEYDTVSTAQAVGAGAATGTAIFTALGSSAWAGPAGLAAGAVMVGISLFSSKKKRKAARRFPPLFSFSLNAAICDK